MPVLSAPGMRSLLHFFQKSHDDRDRVSLVAGFDGLDIFCPVLVEGGDFGDELVGCLFVLEDFAEALLRKGVRVEDLVAAAAFGGQGDEQAGLAEGEDFADRVGARAGNQQVSRRKEVPINKEDSNLFFQLIDMRYEKKSTILTTNINFSDWDSVFYDAVVANAILDRVLHHAHVITISGRSYRLKDHIRADN